MYDATAFVFRIVVLLVEIVKCEGRGKEWVDGLRRASWGCMNKPSLAQEVVLFPGTPLPWLCTRSCPVPASLLSSSLFSPSLPLGLCQDSWPVVAFCKTLHSLSALQKHTS